MFAGKFVPMLTYSFLDMLFIMHSSGAYVFSSVISDKTNCIKTFLDRLCSLLMYKDIMPPRCIIERTGWICPPMHMNGPTGLWMYQLCI